MRNGWAVVAAACALVYAAAKVDFAVRGELGLHGFAASPEAVREYGGTVALGQWGNVAVGLVVAALAVALARPPRGGALLRAASWVGIVLVGAGFVVFALRAVRLVGEPPSSWVAWVTLALGALWVGSWAAATVRHRVSAASGPTAPAAAASRPTPRSAPPP
ncbi:hypothetical protein [Actinokineospora sp.]|uniref:hypothetical protein n=1 Tax=Actinokineospora sp. TaxID=1872133 RepID=UPI004037EDE1